jgi:hypothetical protein
MNRRIIAVLFAVLSLAACNKPGNERRQAAGEILEGSVSDAMIHTDQVRSEGPYAAPEAAKAEKGGKGPAKAAAHAPEAAPTPEASASATVTAAPEPAPSGD